ncbi:MAG: hypothetical protein EOP06_04015 [Proteobacteria bacterium]|nr:MAG: hypothetical protein EOP06_04015 [Pseudomonadota bacterium]
MARIPVGFKIASSDSYLYRDAEIRRLKESFEIYMNGSLKARADTTLGAKVAVDYLIQNNPMAANVSHG